MVVIDIILLLFFGYAIIKGIYKGLVIEIASFIGVIVGIYFARLYAPSFSETIGSWLQLEVQYALPISYGILFSFIILLCHVIAKLLSKALDLVFLGWINKMLGGLFALLKYVFIVSIFLNIFQALDQNVNLISEETKSKSIFYYPVQKVAPMVLPILNEEDFGIQSVKNKIDEIKG